MATRIKFNPVTKEIEIEGTEKFVETHFKKIQELLAPRKEAVKQKPVAKPARVAKKAKKEPAKRLAKKSLKRGDIFNTVVGTIKESGEGITTDALMEKTGFRQQQVRSVVFRAEKQGVIQRLKRGVYVAVGSISGVLDSSS